MCNDGIEVRGEVEIVHLLSAFAAVDVASLCLSLSLSLSLLWFKLIRSFSLPGSFGFGVLIERDEEKATVWCRFGLCYMGFVICGEKLQQIVFLDLGLLDLVFWLKEMGKKLWLLVWIWFILRGFFTEIFEQCV